MKKVLIGLLIGVMLISVGCTKKRAVRNGNLTDRNSETTEISTEEITEPSTEVATETPTEAPTEAPTEILTEPPTETPTEIYIPTVENNPKYLVYKAVEYAVNKDKAAFESLFTEESREKIDASFENLSNFKIDEYNDKQVIKLGDKDIYHYYMYMASSVENSLINFKTKEVNYTFAVALCGGKYLLDISDKAEKYLYELLPYDARKILDAKENNRNCAAFNQGDCSWANSDAVIPGAVDSKVYFVWQDEMGNLFVFFTVRNGFDHSIYLNYETITLSNNQLGEIASFTYNIEEYLYSNSNKTYLLALPYTNVKTGTIRWDEFGALSCNTRIKYE